MTAHQPAQILLVDDDEAIRDLLSLVLEGSGYRVQTATDGRQAQTALSRQQSIVPDLIVLDMMMPGMDGLTFLHWLRQQRRSTTPVLSLTAMETAHGKQRLIDAGANAVLFKPVDTKQLLITINQLLT